MWKALGQTLKVHVLHMWHIHTQVQQRVMGQLLKLATASDDIKEMVANHGGPVQVLQGMQGHPRNNGIQRAGTDLLRCLAFTPRIRHLIADAGVVYVCVCVCARARARHACAYVYACVPIRRLIGVCVQAASGQSCTRGAVIAGGPTACHDITTFLVIIRRCRRTTRRSLLTKR